MSATPQNRESASDRELSASLAAELRAAERQVSDLQRRLSNRESDLRALEARMAAVDREAAARVAEIQQRALQAEQRVLAIYRSSSWRLTGPFRRMMRLANRLFARG